MDGFHSIILQVLLCLVFYQLDIIFHFYLHKLDVVSDNSSRILSRYSISSYGIKSSTYPRTSLILSSAPVTMRPDPWGQSSAIIHTLIRLDIIKEVIYSCSLLQSILTFPLILLTCPLLILKLWEYLLFT